MFFPPSLRFVTPGQAAALSAQHPGGPGRVGLFVEPSDEAVAGALDALTLDVLQVYGTPARAAALRARFGVPVWHAGGVMDRADLPTVALGLDGLLLDAKPPSGSVLPGGNALAFEWSILRGWAAPAPWVLAGGLTAENVADAVRLSGAEAVDVSSGVERRRGEKSLDLIRAFVGAAKSSRAS